jgi:hypothetical protein
MGQILIAALWHSTRVARSRRTGCSPRPCGPALPVAQAELRPGTVLLCGTRDGGSTV